MESIKELSDDLYRDRILRARQGSPGEKLYDALELFEFACSWTEAGIRAQHPSASEQDVKRILRERLNLHRKLEWAKWKRPDTLLP